jgi:Domain of unknown function (DUF1707)
MMDDRIRISDADRERATARLREHFAEGRLNSEELDERITAALSAKTYGDLRRIMADLPEAAPVPPMDGSAPQWAGRPGAAVWRGPRVLPLLFIVLIAALVIPGVGWVFFAFLKVMLVLWLAACLVGIFTAARFRRHLRRQWQSDRWNQWQHHQWRG